jgi:hypothetical protein
MSRAGRGCKTVFGGCKMILGGEEGETGGTHDCMSISISME